MAIENYETHVNWDFENPVDATETSISPFYATHSLTSEELKHFPAMKYILVLYVLLQTLYFGRAVHYTF